jgi:hypothetical protein
MSELVNVVTPVGELYYVNISGQGKENYNEDGYEYTAALRLTGDKAEELKAKIDAVAETIPSGHTLKSTGYKELVRDEEGKLRSPSKTKPKTDDEENTGIWEFTFKTNTTFADGSPKKIAVYNKDAKRVELGNRKIGNGSEGAISGKMKGGSYKKDFSVSLYLNAIQLTKFEEYVGDAGFDAHEEGDFEGVTDKDSGFTGQAEAKSESEEKPKTKAKPKL